jgi:hypothetical protein
MQDTTGAACDESTGARAQCEMSVGRVDVLQETEVVAPPAGLQLPKCWGIGVGRTGSTSLCRALELLGYERVVHNPTFSQLRTLDAAADFEVILFYKYLDYKFPGSKFILTLRELESWLVSEEYIFRKYPVRSRDADTTIMRRMTMLGTVEFDREKFILAYHRHHADVREYFRNRPQDLLEMDILGGDGWEKLCPFLGLPVPQVDFPHLNARENSPAGNSET